MNLKLTCNHWLKWCSDTEWSAPSHINEQCHCIQHSPVLAHDNCSAVLLYQPSVYLQKTEMAAS